MKVIITFTFCCVNLWQSKFMALEKPEKLGIFFFYFVATLLEFHRSRIVLWFVSISAPTWQSYLYGQDFVLHCFREVLEFVIVNSYVRVCLLFLFKLVIEWLTVTLIVLCHFNCWCLYFIEYVILAFALLLFYSIRTPVSLYNPEVTVRSWCLTGSLWALKNPTSANAVYLQFRKWKTVNTLIRFLLMCVHFFDETKLNQANFEFYFLEAFSRNFSLCYDTCSHNSVLLG